MGDAGDHLPEGGHLLRLHQLRLGLLEVHQGLVQHPVALGDAQLHGLEQVEHGAEAAVQAVAVHQDEILGDGVLQASGDLLGGLLQVAVQAQHQGLGVHHVGHRAAAPEVAAEALHEDVLQGVAAHQADGPAAFHHREGQEAAVLGSQQLVRHIADAQARRQRRHRSEQAFQRVFGCHWRLPRAR